ncbi:MAG: hypothetical protein DCC75_06970 [Proteobacteria bacterium]|nr:MAG: hypothetical protein DCC75_06970 [Pseudomonadota bacterium]
MAVEIILFGEKYMKRLLGAFAVATLMAAGSAMAADTAHEYGGNCAWGMTLGKEVHTDCKITWTDTTTHKNYCFANEENKKHFAQDTKGSIAKANTEWTKHSGHAATGHDSKRM